MEKRRIIYWAEAPLQKIRNYILDGIAIIVFGYCCFHISENPVVILIVMAFVVFSFLTSGYNKVLVYSDGIQFEVKHVIDSLSKRWFFAFDDIQSIDADLQLTKRGFMLSEILTTYMPGNSIWNTISIRLHDGTEKKIGTKVYKSDLVNMLNVAREASKNKIIITGI